MLDSSKRSSLGRAVLVVFAASALATAAVSPVSAQEKASVRLKWVAQAQFAGIYVAQSKGYYKAEGLDMTINPGGPNLNAETLVASGADTFAVGGGTESTLAARDKKLPIETLAMLHQRTPYVFVVLADSPIQKFADFKGKKITTFFTGAQHTLHALMRRQGMQPTDASITAQGVSMTPFIDKQIDVATVTLYNELNVLKARGVNVRVFAPDDFGLSMPRDTLITSTKVMSEKPKAVQGFMNATLRGWKYAINNQAEAVDIVMAAAPGLDKTHQTAMLAEVARLMVANAGTSQGLGALDMGRLKVAHDILLEAKMISAPVEMSSAFNAKFWQAVPDADKKM